MSQETQKKARNTVIFLIIFLILAVLIICFVFFKLIDNREEKSSNTNIAKPNKSQELNKIDTSDDINIVPTLLDKISTNSAWCATFQLVWNDMQDEVVRQDIVFNPQIEMVRNLNEQSFTQDNIEDEYYYKVYGLKTLDLKEKIEKGIKEKFDQKSDILDFIDWTDTPQDESGYGLDYRRYLFYTMLYREFNFNKEFTVLDDDEFKGTEETYYDTEYFGIDYSTSSTVYNQVDVLYYNSKEDFAVILNTKEGDEVLLVKGENGNSFGDIYENVMAKKRRYKGEKYFTENDTLKVPKIKFDKIREYEELENKVFKTADNSEGTIVKALQSIKFELDEKGGKIKSEAVIDATFDAIALEEEEPEYRYFELDSTFTMFLIDDDHEELPYFAAYIDDITLYQ